MTHWLCQHSYLNHSRMSSDGGSLQDWLSENKYLLCLVYILILAALERRRMLRETERNIPFHLIFFPLDSFLINTKTKSNNCFTPIQQNVSNCRYFISHTSPHSNFIRCSEKRGNHGNFSLWFLFSH